MNRLPAVKLKFDFKTLLSLVAGVSFILSLAHHWFNFWGLSWEIQACLLLVAAPALAVLIRIFLAPVWDTLPQINGKSAILVLVPILLLSAIITWRTFSPPMSQHQLEILAPQRLSALQDIQVLEIKVPAVGGSVVPFSQLKNPAGWVVEDNVLKTNGSSPAPIRYAFFGPVNAPVNLTLLTSNHSAPVTIILDGQAAEFDLAKSTPGQSSVSLNTRYVRFQVGVDGAILEALIVLIDLLALGMAMALLVLIQEVSRTAIQAGKQERPVTRVGQHAGLLIVVLLSLVLHIFNAFSVPLYLGTDSPSYLRGAIQLLQFHNLDGAWPYGPGMALLLAPVLSIFARNAWGVKILLHLLAIACVPVTYRIGWQLTGRRAFAFAAGLIAALTPDLFLYSNFVMSDLPNVFIGLLFCTLLLSSLEALSWKWCLATMLVGTCAALLRAENAGLMIIALVFLAAKNLLDGGRLSGRGVWFKFAQLGLVAGLAALPLLGWSVHNDRRDGYFGLSNYFGEVLYDGWVYFGENSHMPIADQNSAAVRTIAQVYQPLPGAQVKPGTPTGWGVYAYLLQAGYTSNQSMSILGQAARDSIFNNPSASVELVFVKLREAFSPETQVTVTFHLPGEPAQTRAINSLFFDDDNISIPVLIQLQRSAYQVMEQYYQDIYPAWIWICIGAMFLCFFRKPVLVWLPVVSMTAYRLFFAQLIGLSNWRYAIAGVVLVQILGLAMLESVSAYSVLVIRYYANRPSRFRGDFFHRLRR